MVPAAVVSMGKNFGADSAAISMARYPATAACELSTSIAWARVVRGSSSSA
jgi:hypothetical protein